MIKKIISKIVELIEIILSLLLLFWPLIITLILDFKYDLFWWSLLFFIFFIVYFCCIIGIGISYAIGEYNRVESEYIKRINNGKTAKEITEELIEEAKKQINNTEYETNS